MPSQEEGQECWYEKVAEVDRRQGCFKKSAAGAFLAAGVGQKTHAEDHRSAGIGGNDRKGQETALVQMAQGRAFGQQYQGHDHQPHGTHAAVLHDRQAALTVAMTVETVGRVGQAVQMKGAGDGGQQGDIQYRRHAGRPNGGEHEIAHCHDQADDQTGQGKVDDDAFGVEGARPAQGQGADELQGSDQSVHGRGLCAAGLMVTGMPATVQTTRSQAAAMAWLVQPARSR
ncbi:hypothetical protein DESC_370223 [Desulfosarcina cetonica]|nr:hypothetical protein DESC_370223 [Desulfosarcina cetonica]